MDGPRADFGDASNGFGSRKNTTVAHDAGRKFDSMSAQVVVIRVVKLVHPIL